MENKKRTLFIIECGSEGSGADQGVALGEGPKGQRLGMSQ